MKPFFNKREIQVIQKRITPLHKDIVISLFDESGVMVDPWIKAGYTAYIIDIKHDIGWNKKELEKDRKLKKIHFDLRTPWLCNISRSRIAAVFAFPPCDHLAVSGSRWFKGKGLRALEKSIGFFATAIEFCEWSQAPYMIENPISTISTYWRKPDPIIHPYYFTGHTPEDNYTKQTCLWTGNDFLIPPKFRKRKLGKPDDRIHKMGGANKEKRSLTPLGFAKAVFLANGLKIKRTAKVS